MQKDLKKELNLKDKQTTPDKGIEIIFSTSFSSNSPCRYQTPCNIVNWIYNEIFIISLEETSSDDWEKLSSGSKSPRKQSKEGEDEDWVQT